MANIKQIDVSPHDDDDDDENDVRWFRITMSAWLIFKTKQKNPGHSLNSLNDNLLFKK